MLLSHVAAGLAAKKFAPRVSLGTLVLAGIFADLVFGVLVMTGVEHFRIVPGYTLMSPYEMTDTPFSHGLLANLFIAALFGGIYFLIKKDRRSSIILGLVVLSHWILDFISHRPDMVLISKSLPSVGLELWSSYWGTLAVETGLFVAGLIIYLRATKARQKIAMLPLIIFILWSALQFFSWLFNTPAATDNFNTAMYFVFVIFVLVWPSLAYWTDSLRDAK